LLEFSNNNQLTALPAFNCDLRDVSFWNNKITSDKSRFIKGSAQLEKLNLSCNKISVIEEEALFGQPGISVLNLSADNIIKLVQQ
jgi:Leucine-rich repeat (LRR) protein